MKYVVFKSPNGEQTGIIFPNHIAHIDIGQGDLRHYINRSKWSAGNIGEAVSAGFVNIEDGVLVTYGESGSLGIKSRKDDYKILLQDFGMDDYAKREVSESTWR